ncbi:uncharacterized protein LOC143795407 [Ranitomeya variabilis]|uniref:uncharacterized protein LOC143795407 n=1 Tax=Ranitomeya variabilis TaxID=490064 RepID=UPI004055E95E
MGHGTSHAALLHFLIPEQSSVRCATWVAADGGGADGGGPGAGRNRGKSAAGDHRTTRDWTRRRGSGDTGRTCRLLQQLCRPEEQVEAAGQQERRHRHRASAAATTAATSGSPQPGPSHAVTPPLQTTPPFRHPSSSPGSACFSPAASSPALALAHARGWVVSSSSDEQQASFLQPDTVRGLLAKQQRMERTVALLMQQVQQHGRTLRHLLRHGRI